MTKILLSLLLAFTSFYANGQDRIWKKQVSRIIDIRDTTSGNTDSIITKTIVDAVRSGRAGIYSTINNDFSTLLTIGEMKDIFERAAIEYIVDPITGKSLQKVSGSELTLDSVYRYKIFEEWTFNPVTGRMNGQIKYVGPVRSVYGPNGEYRGKQTLFWLNYNDFLLALAAHSNVKQLLLAFSGHLWQSYFEQDSLTSSYYNNKTGLWYADASSRINIATPKDSNTHFLRDENPDTFFSKLIVNEIKANRIPAWSGNNIQFSTLLSTEQVIKEITVKVDTETIVDPVTNHEIIRIIPYDITNAVDEYNILGNWSFNAAAGKTEIEIKGISPFHKAYYEGGAIAGTIMFWVRYPDIQPILNRIEQYHPNNTFAMRIWDSFFSDTKPVLVK